MNFHLKNKGTLSESVVDTQEILKALEKVITLGKVNKILLRVNKLIHDIVKVDALIESAGKFNNDFQSLLMPNRELI